MIGNILNNLPEFFNDALFDTLKLVPLLLIIFVLIEVFENFFAHKIANIVSFSKKLGPILAALLAIIPQCGFSVIMTTLYIKKYITIGTLISVYIATSDEAIPILLANPSYFNTVLKIILIKVILAVVVGYIVDFAIKSKLHECEEVSPCSHLKMVETEKGCCSHELKENKIKNIIIHPLKHTLIISFFILVCCIALNLMFTGINQESFGTFIHHNAIFESMFFALFGLIPNCAVSVLITMMFIKGLIGFGSVIAGLSTNAGLGLLVLFSKKENIKSVMIIVSILLVSGFLAGLIFNLI